VRFKGIYGQEESKAYLKSLVVNNRLPHALLFTGKEGSGKLAMALAFASYIQCQNREQEDSCGSCPACRKSDQYIHPDIHYVIPSVTSDSKNKVTYKDFYEAWRSVLADTPYLSFNDWMNEISTSNRKGNIPKSSIMELIKTFNLKIFEGKKKIALIWYADLLGNEGNRLLKMIEEPPENSVFILIAENLDQVLNTIVSRCQIIKIAPFKDKDLQDFTYANYQIDKERADQLVQVANGNINELIKLTESTNEDLYKQLFSWLRMSYQAKAIDLVSWSNTFGKKSKDNQKYFFKTGLSFFEQYLLSFSLERKQLRLSQDALAIVDNMKKVINEEQTFMIIDLLNRCILNLTRNANMKLQMMNSSLTLHKIMTGR